LLNSNGIIFVLTISKLSLSTLMSAQQDQMGDVKG